MNRAPLAERRMAQAWLFCLAGFVLLASGCGARSSGAVARPQIAHLNWHENCGTRVDPIPIATRRLVVEKGVWRVALSFRNRTRATLFIVRPHFPGSTYFGLEPFRTSSWREVLERANSGAAKPRTLAERFRPALPRLLPPGRGWSGEFSGRAALPAGVPIRVVLGRFVATKPIGFLDQFLCISARVIRLSWDVQLCMTPSDEERAFWNTTTYLPDAVRVDVGSPEMEDLRYALAVLEQLTT